MSTKPICKVCKQSHWHNEPHIIGSVTHSKGSVTPKKSNVTGNVTSTKQGSVTAPKGSVTGSVTKQDKWLSTNKDKMKLWRKEYMRRYRNK